MEPLDPLQLRTFVAIADCGGFRRAADHLYLSQPTVSQHVRLLERRLGRALVERDGRRARLTPAGEQLLSEARRILAVNYEALRLLEVGASPPLRVGSTEHAADQNMPGMITALLDALRDRNLVFRFDSSAQLADDVARGALDVAVVLGGTSSAAITKVGTLALRWLCAPGWEAPAPGEPWPLTPFVEPCGIRQIALHALAGEGYQVTIPAESTSLEGVLAAARAGLGVALLPIRSQVPPGLTVRRDLPDLGALSLRVVTRRGLDAQVASTAATALQDYLERRPRLLSVTA